jgi:hypothetical protein
MGAGDEINFATIVPEAMNDFDGVDSFSGTTGAITLPDRASTERMGREPSPP